MAEPGREHLGQDSTFGVDQRVGADQVFSDRTAGAGRAAMRLGRHVTYDRPAGTVKDQLDIALRS